MNRLEAGPFPLFFDGRIDLISAIYELVAMTTVFIALATALIAGMTVFAYNEDGRRGDKDGHPGDEDGRRGRKAPESFSRRRTRGRPGSQIFDSPGVELYHIVVVLFFLMEIWSSSRTKTDLVVQLVSQKSLNRTKRKFKMDQDFN